MNRRSSTQAARRPETANQRNSNSKLLRVCLEGDSGTRRAVTRLPDSLEGLHDAVRRVFRLPNDGTNLIVKANIPCFGETLEVDPALWDEIKGEIDTVWIHSEASPDVPRSGRHSALHPDQYTIFVMNLTGQAIQVRVTRHSGVDDLKNMIREQIGMSPDQQRLIYSGRELEDRRMLADYQIDRESTLHLISRLTGGKPVIYLFSPTTLDALVDLRLVPGWTFSALYPMVPIKEQKERSKRLHMDEFNDTVSQLVTWNVQVSPNGTLVDKDSGSSVSYLYWEALTNPKTSTNVTPPTSRPSSPTIETFDPACPDINPSNSVLMSIGKIPKYLDNALLALGLHTEARTSFITYWLPSLLRHANIALRFLPQSAYEEAAPLKVHPEPTSVVRIFMLWKGIPAEEIIHWEEAGTRAVEMNVGEWRNVVEVPTNFDLERQRSEGDGLTVLEWGGMEVKG